MQWFLKTKTQVNVQIGEMKIKRFCAVKADNDKSLETSINKLGLRARPYSRVLKVGRTIADLAGRNISKRRTSPKRSSIGAWIGGCKRENSGKG